jgi:hypothetical protein
MKKILSAVAIASLTWAMPTYAVDEHHPEQQKGAPAQAAPKDSQAVQKQPAPSKAVAPTTSTPEGAGMSMGMMDNMQKMQEQMQLMQKHMEMMSGMMGPGMMKEGGMMGDAESSAGTSMDKRMQRMEQRMDMMRQMMGQMLQQQEMMMQMMPTK